LYYNRSKPTIYAGLRFQV